MNLNSIGTTSGATPYDEQGLQVVIDAIPGVPNTGGTPIFCTDITADTQPAEDWITHRSEGSKEDDYSAVLREWATVSGNLAPDYKLLLWKDLAMFGLPVSQTPGVLPDGREYVDLEFRLPTFGSVDRALVSFQWGPPRSAYLLPYGIIQALTINNAATGNTDGSITMIAKKGTKNQLMIGYGTNEVKNITAVGIAGPSVVVVPATPLGAGGNLTLNPDMTAKQIRIALAAIAAIRDVKNVAVEGDIVDGDGEIVITFRGALTATNVADFTTVAAGLVTTTVKPGVAPVGVPVPYEPRPILPKHWWHKRGASRVAAFAADKLKDVETHSIEFADMANPHYTEDQSDTFTDHVDGPVNVRGNIGVTYDDDQDSLCQEMFKAAHSYISLPEWHIMGADCPDGLHKATWGIYASVSDVAGYGNENNVYRQTFPFSRKKNTNGAEGYSFFHILRVPADMVE